MHTGDTVYTLVVAFSFERAEFRYMVRRLVYEAFVQPVKERNMSNRFVYPLDGNGLNCRAENLGLASRSELRVMALKQSRYVPPARLMPKEYFHKQAKKGGKLKRRKVTKYTLDGIRKAVYPSLTKAAEKNGVSIGCVGLCVQKKLKSLKGFVYRYEEESYNGDWKGIKKSVVQYTPEGKKVAVFKSITEAGHKLNILPNSIIRVTKGRLKQAGGYVWRYTGDSYSGEYAGVLKKTNVLQYSHDGKILDRFASVSEAARKTGFSYEGIRLTVQGKSKSSGGFFWKWEESVK